MIVDSHVHVWEPQLLRYPWLEDESDLRRSLLPPAIETVAQSTRMVFVQADCLPEQALDEVRWVTSLHWPELAGVVAAVNLRSPHLEGDLEALPILQRKRPFRACAICCWMTSPAFCALPLESTSQIWA